MYNSESTRRSRRFNRPTRPPNQPHEIDDTHNGDDPATNSSRHVRPRRAVPPDTLRGAMLVILIVVTVVLYVILRELERSSFMFMPIDKPNLNQSTKSTPRSIGIQKAGSTWHPQVIQHEPSPSLHSSEGLRLPEDQTATRPNIPSRTTTNAWPPPVTRVPEDLDTDSLVDERTREELSAFDAVYCDGSCRFLLPIRIAEQESKARVHVTQLAMLARALNRTIVLPNVGNSRMGACSKWPFGAYYDTSVFARSSDSSDSRLAMGLEGFSRWVDERPGPPSAFVVSMNVVHQGRRDALETPVEDDDAPFVVDRTEIDSKILSCLESKFARLGPLPETALSVSFDRDALKAESDASARLVRLLSSRLDDSAQPDFDSLGPSSSYAPPYMNLSWQLADVDVLVLDYDLRRPLFPASAQPRFTLHYAPALYDLADRLADNLGPFLGVHWRMETVPVQNLAWCAAALVSTLRARLEDDSATGAPVRHVWFATDYPRPLGAFSDGVPVPVMSDGDGRSEKGRHDDGPQRKSSTFKVLSSEHDGAIEVLAEAFQPGGDLDAWTLTDLAEQLRRYPYVEGKLDVDGALSADAGVWGILDKLVVVQARAFVSGSTDCSKASSFSKQVIEARQESFEAEQGKGAIRNVVELFGKW